MTAATRALQSFERVLLAMGLLALGFYGAVWLHGWVGYRLALQEFDESRADPGLGRYRDLTATVDREVDFALWSGRRVQAYRESFGARGWRPLAVLAIDRLRIRVPVFEGTDEIVLNRGAGWINGTSRPGEDGNIGIAGHRDGFFRALKDTRAGDEIELATSRGSRRYTVDQIEIVQPDDVDVLNARPAPSVTLVTCYPFYFIGDAPQRFVLHASLKN